MADRQRFTAKYLTLLFIACLIIFLGISAGLFAYGKEPIWRTDGSSLYVNKFIYVGEQLRQGIASFISGNGFSLSEYAFNVGYGRDVTAFFEDPFSLVAVFCPVEYSEYFYIALVLLRLYLAAVTFSFYCLQRGIPRYSSFVGSLCYSFCGFTLFWGMLRHPFFIAGSIMLPLVLAGADRILSGRGGVLFAASLGISLVLSVYQAYMICFMLVVYCLLNFFFGEVERSVKSFFSLLARFVGLAILSFCIAGIVFLPKVLVLSSLDRVTSPSSYVPSFYRLEYYKYLPGGLIFGRISARAVYLGAVAVVAAIVFVVCRKHFPRGEWRIWSLLGLAVLACVMIPPLSSALNGFNYATDRWMFIGAFVFSYIVSMVLPHLREFNRREKVIFFIVAAVFLVAACGGYFPGKHINAHIVIMGSLFVVAALLLVIVSPKVSRRWGAAMLSACVIAGSIGAGLLEVLPDVGAGMETQFAKIGGVYSAVMKQSSAAAMDAVDDDSVYRYSLASYDYFPKNSSLNHEKWAIDNYTSSYNQAVKSFRDGLGIASLRNPNSFIGSDSRLAIDLLTGAKYFTAKASRERWVPYGYDEVSQLENGWKTWRTENSLPVVFTEDKTIDREVYDSLSTVARQEALLQGCVIDGMVSSDYDRIDPEVTSSSKPFELDASDGLRYEDGVITVLKKNATATLTFSGDPKAETYLVINNLKYRFVSPSALQALKGKHLSSFQAFMKDASWSLPLYCDIEISSESGEATLELQTSAGPQSNNNTNWVKNLGYSDTARTTMTLKFPTTGKYAFDSLEVVCQPVDPIVEKAENLMKGAAKSIDVSRKRVDAVIETDRDSELAVFTFAYSSGWRAKVDGVPADVHRADVAFMAVEVPPGGEHNVTLEYTSPGLTEGLVCSLLGVLGLVALYVLERRRRASGSGAPLEAKRSFP